MKKYSQLQKIISVLMIFIVLVQFSGCYSTKIMSISDIPDSGRYKCIIHVQDSKYYLENFVLSNGVLSGNINPDDHRHRGNLIHVYLSTDSVIKIKTGRILSIPVDKIVKVEIKKMDTVKSLLVVVATITLILILGNELRKNVFSGVV